MATVGVLTSRAFPQLFSDDQPLLPLLAAAGFTPEPMVWNDSDRETLPELILIRTPWDYFENFPAFLKFLNWTEQSGSRLYNPLSLVRWNLDKRYLAELEGKGVPIVPTIFIPKGASFWERDNALIQLPWPSSGDGVVIKPTVSAGAFLTSRVQGDLADVDRTVANVLAVQSVMIQPFAAEIATEGEISLIYFNDGTGWELSHSVLKRTNGADFRVQSQFGGSESPCDATSDQIAVAEKTLTSLPEPGLYARVDLIPWEGSWVLSEVELIEPQLFFRYAAGSPEKFVDAFTKSSRF